MEMKGSGTYIFIIYYKKETNRFYIRTYRDKLSPSLSLVLIKLDSKYFIRKKEILAIGDIYFQLQVLPEYLEIIKLSSKSSQETK